MGNQTGKDIKGRLAFFGDVRNTTEMHKAVEACTPIIVDLSKLERNQIITKKAA